jgi:lipid-A-disaccharide synthase
VVPELLQGDCRPDVLAAAVQAGLDDAAGALRVAQRFTELHHLLKRDTAHCATDAVAQILQA